MVRRPGIEDPKAGGQPRTVFLVSRRGLIEDYECRSMDESRRGQPNVHAGHLGASGSGEYPPNRIRFVA